MYLILVFAARIVVQVVRDVTLILKNNKYLELKDCIYVPKSKKNLILVSSLTKLNYSIYFDKNLFIRKNDSFICSNMLVDNLFCITPTSLLSIVKNNHVSLKRKVSSTNQTYIWHLRLGHTNLNRIQILVKSGILHFLISENLPICESSIESTMIKRSFTAKGVRAKECLKLVHTNMWTF